MTDMADTQSAEESDSEERSGEAESVAGTDSVSESMSVDDVTIFLCRHGIPHRYCEVFEGKTL